MFLTRGFAWIFRDGVHPAQDHSHDKESLSTAAAASAEPAAGGTAGDSPARRFRVMQAVGRSGRIHAVLCRP